MLDQRSGSLILSPTTCLRPGDSLDATCALLVTETTELRDMHTGWQWLWVRNVLVDDLYHVLDLGFYQQQLRRVALVVSPTRFGFPATWDGWSAEAEARSLVLLKQRIRTQVGQEGSFA